MKQSTQQRLKQLMSERNLKQIDILNMSLPLQKETGIKISKSHLSQYVNGKSSPDQHKLYLLAKTLNVSEAWLLGYDVPMEKHTNDITSIYNKLTEKNKKVIYDLAKQKLEEQDSVVKLKTREGSNKNNLIHTLAAHSEDPDRSYSKEEVDYIESILDKARKKYEEKNDK